MNPKVILITGVSSGFGLAMAQRLYSDGYIVYGTVRRDCKQIDGVHYLHADVRNSDEVKKAVDSVLAAEGRIDVLINNAGMGIGGPVEFTPEEDITLQMDTNFMGQVRFAKAVLPQMRSNRCGTIICFSSIGGRLGLPFQGFYSASKFAVEGFCEALQIEVAKFGINVILVEPGDFATGFTQARKKSDFSEAGKIYPNLEQSVQSFENDETSGLTPQFLAAKISKIVSRRHPKFRYVIATFVQKLSIPLKSILSGRCYAKVIGMFYKV
ncbi:MAG: SDR family oxidoreductase [Bacteroidales bacterium]|nr:SDR family oxidoreductase [Bacteroidales bacterium]MDD4670953.1 SDR family oxidoreductase [Bacteroidales bacterium]